MKKIKNYIKKNENKFIKELISLLKIPSISADSEYKKEVNKMSLAIKKEMEKCGVKKTKIFQTKGHPIVYGEHIIDKNKPTVLIYGQDDVQPPDPIELWQSWPFDPIIKKTKTHPKGAIFARGACDDKGQLFMHIKAFEILNKLNMIKCNIKFLIEGEEEVGSENLEPFVKKNKKLLNCDTILISDSGIIDNKNPSIETGLRGLSYLEVEVTGANRDLHSGLYGGAVPNPINILCDMIAALKDKNNKITIPGFYENVTIINKQDKKQLKKIPFNLKKYKNEIGINDIIGEKGFSTIERTGIRPTLDVNGIWGGYIGEGSKTVIPSKAYAKISMRLVPNQSSQEITKLFTKHFKKIAPNCVKIKVTPHHGGEPYVCPTTMSAYKAAEQAMQTTFNKKPVPVRGGGSIPIVALFEKELKTKSILMGFGLDSDAIHSPNEHFGIFNFLIGIETICLFYHNYDTKR